MNKVVEYRQEIFNAPSDRSEAVLSAIADRLEDDLLSSADLPDDYFGFILDLLSQQQFFSRPGVWNFLLALSTERDKLLPKHYDQLASAMVKNYASYENEDLCLAVCDFVARNYPHVTAREILLQLKRIELNKEEKLRGFADEGLWILDREISREAGR